MVAVAVLVTEVAGESSRGKADARLTANLETGISVYDDELARSRRAARASRGIDEAARYGGEEFVLALPETGPEGALEAAERVRTRVEAAQVPRVDGAGAIRITARVGVASMPGAARDVRNLIAAADAALYRAKGSGKNRSEQAATSEESGWSVVAQGQSVERRT